MINVLAQSSADLGSVPADFVKYFIICALAGLGAWAAYKKGQQGSKSDPVHVHQPLSIREHHEAATRKELEEVREDIAARTRENLRAHEQHRLEAQKILSAGEERFTKLSNLLHDMERRMTKATLDEIKDLHNRINPLAEMVKSHESSISSLVKRCDEMWAWICKVWEHVTKKIKP